MNFNEKPRCDEATSWTLAGLWLLVIYVTIPLARTIQEYVRDHGGKVLFLWVTFAALILSAVWVFRSVMRKELVLSPIRAIILTVVLGVFAWMTWSLRANPEESIHFIQYGVLSLLLHRAFCHRIRDASIYVAGITLGISFGIIDELIQWVVPKRFFDFRDIGINALAIALVQLAVAVGIRPAIIQNRMKSTGLRIGFAVMILNLLMLLFCISNTPEFRHFYSRYFPAAADINDMTVEYGYLYKDEETGGFKSRLPPEELARQDRERHTEIIPILNEFKNDRQYMYFMSKAEPYKDPYLVEARVHIFRRDRYARLCRETNDDEKLKRSHAAVAFQENLILEKYFPNTIKNSRYVWPDDVRQQFEKLSQGIPRQISPVSSALVTRISQRSLTIVLIGLMVCSFTGLIWSIRREDT